MDRAAFAAWVGSVGGVATRGELEEWGIGSATIASRVRLGEWQRPLPGVCVLSPGIPTWEQRISCVQKWLAGRGVFSHQTAAYLHGLRRDPPDVLEVVVPLSVGLRSTVRCRVRRTGLALSRVGDPPRTSLEQTVVDLVNAASSEVAVLDILIVAVQKRMSVPRFLRQLERCPRVRNRGFVLRVMEITAEGVESHLELEYRRRAERAHGLPRATRQRWELVRRRWIRSDCWYPEYRVRVELDGELAHPGRATDDDLIRDNDVRLARDEITLRYRWPHVWSSPCLVAGQVSAALRGQGWRGRVTGCSPGCTAMDVAESYRG